MQTHLEPLSEADAGRRRGRELGRPWSAPPGPAAALRRAYGTGVVAFVTLGLDPGATLAEAHARASDVEERLRRARPDVADVIVHTEP